MQQAKSEVEQFLKELLELDLFLQSVKFSEGKRTEQEGKWALLCGEMLLQQYYGEYCVQDFTEQSVSSFLDGLERRFTDKQKNILASAVEYLSEAFYEKGVQIEVEEIPVLIGLAEYAQNRGIFPEVFMEWWCTAAKKT